MNSCFPRYGEIDDTVREISAMTLRFRDDRTRGVRTKIGISAPLEASRPLKDRGCRPTTSTSVLAD